MPVTVNIIMLILKPEMKLIKPSNELKGTWKKRLAKEAKSNPKPFYQCMAKQTKCHTKVGPLKDKNGEIQNKDEKMADMLNQ